MRVRKRTKVQEVLSEAERERRIAVCNLALKHFMRQNWDHKIQLRYWRGMRVAWQEYRTDHYIEKKWMTNGQDFYPVWHRRWGGGGTSCHALASLVYWCMGRPTLPLTTWRHWVSPSMNLCPSFVADILEAGGFPKIAKCVLCGVELRDGHDWWSLEDVKGPCCHGNRGCRQKPPADVG